MPEQSIQSLLLRLASSRKRWAAKHNETLSRLRPGASEAAIAKLSVDFDLSFPAEFVELYRCHDGEEPDDAAPSLFDNYFMPLEGVDGVIAEFSAMSDVRADSDYQVKGPMRRMLYNSLWLPFTKDFGGNFTGFDLDPATGGNLGQIIVFGCDEVNRVVAPNLLEFLLEQIKD